MSVANEILLSSAWEGSTPTITAIVHGETGDPIAGTGLLSLHLTLMDATTKAVVGGRNDQDILGTVGNGNVPINGGFVDESGNLTLALLQADMVIVRTPKPQTEKHILKFTFSWVHLSVTKHGVSELILPVDRVDVPA